MENNKFVQVDALEFVQISWEMLYNDDALELEIAQLNSRSKSALNTWI